MVSSLYANKDRYYINFADSYFAEYNHLKYGLKTCVPLGKLWQDQLRYDLLEYGGDTDFCNYCVDVDLAKVVIYYPGSTGPTCNIIKENNTFIYNQPCNNPQSVWTITHNLGYVPNVFIEDCTGCDIEGVVTVLNNSTIIITFSQPVAGKAYLS
jgi:hypothetical protein